MFRTVLLAAVAATALAVPAQAFTADRTLPAGRFVVQQGRLDDGTRACTVFDRSDDNSATYGFWRSAAGLSVLTISIDGTTWSGNDGSLVSAWVDDQRYDLSMTVSSSGKVLVSDLLTDDFRHALYNGQVLTLVVGPRHAIFSLQGSAVALAVVYHCAGSPAPATTVTTTAAVPGTIMVPIDRQHGGIYASATFNHSVTIMTMLDSGATDVVIPRTLALELMAGGSLTQADYVGLAKATLADGREIVQVRYLLRAITVAGHTVTDVICSVSDGQDVLLGQGFLDKFSSWSIDNGRNLLVLNR
ncbi:MAG TPA: retropepsin-like aspartic protease [Acidobacteriaceae bacterium]|nr:retropepsin-like aspartic protease [Acidobacteriaceae bacterium]